MIYSGEAILRIGEEELRVRKGYLYCIPANAPHGDTTIGDESFVMLEIFYPVREDFRESVLCTSGGDADKTI